MRQKVNERFEIFYLVMSDWHSPPIQLKVQSVIVVNLGYENFCVPFEDAEK